MQSFRHWVVKIMGRKNTVGRDVMPINPRLQLVRYTIIAIIVLAPISLLALLVYPTAKVWRAHMLSANVNRLVTQGSMTEAAQSLIAAYHLAPTDVEVLRSCGRFSLAKGDGGGTATFYDLLISQPKATRDDQREAMRAFLTIGDLKRAEGVSEKLMAQTPEAEDYVLKGQLLWSAHQVKEAIATLRQALEMEPKNRANELLLAKMLGISGTDEGQVEAMNRLRSLAQTQDTEGLNALILMASDRALDAATRKGIMDQLRSHPLLNDEGRFAAWELEVGLGVRDAKIVLQDAVDYFKSADLMRKGVAARWLYTEGQPELALKLATEQDSPANQALFLARLDALAKLSQWDEVQKELQKQPVPLKQSKVFLYRARAAAELGNAKESASDWDQARSAAVANADAQMLSEMGNYALATGLYNEAKKTFLLMTKTPGLAQMGYTSLLQVESAHGTTAEMLATLKQMKTDMPNEPEPKNDWAYMSLLLNTNVQEASEASLALAKAHPEMLAYRSTFALSCVRRNDLTEAAKVYEQLNVDWTTVPASWKMVYAVTLAANGNKTQASEVAKTINRAQLRPEESALLDTYLPQP